MPANSSGYGYTCSIIIPVFNKAEYTLACLESLAATVPDGLYEVIIVDNASTDGTADLLRRLEGDVTVISNPENLGFSAACNQGGAAARGEYLLFLNNDIVAHEGWFEPLLAAVADDPTVGAAGARLLFADGTIQHAGVGVAEVAFRDGEILPYHAHYQLPGSHPKALERRDVSAVTGACLLVRGAVFKDVGGFDEGYWNGYEDMELCFAIRERGWRIVYEPQSSLTHFESVSGPERYRRAQHNVARLQERWKGRIVPEVLAVDPDTTQVRGRVATFREAA